MIQIRLAKHKGYCFGVKRAIEMVEKALEEGPYPIWTLGPVIHNPVVVDELTKRGVRIANDISQVDSGTLILRTHGTTLEERQKIPPNGSPYRCDMSFCCPGSKRGRRARSCRQDSPHSRRQGSPGSERHPVPRGAGCTLRKESI